MSLTPPPLGCVPDRPESRDADRETHGLASSGGMTGHNIVQPIGFIREQYFPGCVGYALGACIDAELGEPPWCSAVSIWREARRRQGVVEQIDEGTRIEYAIAGLVARGWDKYREGEDDDTEEAGLNAPAAGDDLADELYAYDKRQIGVERYRISSDGEERLDQIDVALARGLGVVFGTGTRKPFYTLGPDAIADERHLGGDENGHAMRVFGRFFQQSTRLYLIQNSWSESFGGCRSPTGLWFAGCFVAKPIVLLESWDVHCLRVKP